MTEDEQAHRIAWEKTALQAAIGDKRRGQYMGGFIAAGAILGSVVVTLGGAAWQVGVALVGVPVLGIIQALIGRGSNE